MLSPRTEFAVKFFFCGGGQCRGGHLSAWFGSTCPLTGKGHWNQYKLILTDTNDVDRMIHRGLHRISSPRHFATQALWIDILDRALEPPSTVEGTSFGRMVSIPLVPFWKLLEGKSCFGGWAEIVSFNMSRVCIYLRIRGWLRMTVIDGSTVSVCVFVW